MKILLTNDDGYQAKGLQALVRIMKNYGEVTVVAPKKHQSGMSMAISLGLKPLAHKDLGMIDGVRWMYLDGTPASCAKFAMDEVFKDEKPDVVISGINHGFNSSTAMWYSGTIGAAREAALDGSLSIALSLDNLSKDADFSVVEELFPAIFEKLMANLPKGCDVFYNINFPNRPAEQIKGIKTGRMGYAHWEREYRDYGEFLRESGYVPSEEDCRYVARLEPDERLYVMAGDFTDNGDNPADADHLLLEQGYVVVTPQNIDNTDKAEIQRLCGII